MVIIGLAGGSGSGKGLLCRMLASNGIPSFDCDAVYHGMILVDSPVTRELTAVFGETVRATGGGIDRGKLASIVFSHGGTEARNRLNEIAHRHIREACLQWLSERRECGCSAVVVDAPLLFESGFDRMCDLTVAVTAPTETRIARILERDSITEKQARSRIAAQTPDEKLQALADFTIRNNGSEQNLIDQAEKLLKRIKETEHERENNRSETL